MVFAQHLQEFAEDCGNVTVIIPADICFGVRSLTIAFWLAVLVLILLYFLLVKGFAVLFLV